MREGWQPATVGWPRISRMLSRRRRETGTKRKGGYWAERERAGEGGLCFARDGKGNASGRKREIGRFALAVTSSRGKPCER